MQKLLTPDEVAEYLGVKKSTIYQWTHQDFIPHIKIGRCVRFKEQEIENWLDKRSLVGKKSLRVTLDELN